MSRIVLEKSVKCRDRCLNHSREIPPQAVGSGIFDSFSLYFRPEVDNDVISSVTVDYVGLDVRVKFGDSRSNGSRNIRGADFASSELTNMIEAYLIRAKLP